MASGIYNSAFRDVMSGDMSLATDSFKVMLVSDTYTFDPDTHTTRSDVSGEVTGTGYTAGGISAGIPFVVQDNAGNRAIWGFTADITWASTSLTARGAVFYQDTGSDDTDRLVVYVDFGSDQTSTSEPFTVDLPDSGYVMSWGG